MSFQFVYSLFALAAMTFPDFSPPYRLLQYVQRKIWVLSARGSVLHQAEDALAGGNSFCLPRSFFEILRDEDKRDRPDLCAPSSQFVGKNSLRGPIPHTNRQWPRVRM